MQTIFEESVADLIIRAVNLEGVQSVNVAPDSPLFGSGSGSLGLDSIDALEIAVAIQKQYGVQIKADDENNLNVFASLRSLARFIESQIA